MNKTKIFILLASSMLITSCANSSNGNNSSTDTGSTEPIEPVDDYNENWKPGKNAIEGATQPTLKNPQGKYNDLGKLRATQDKVGLPQSGEANILVVPVQFKNDSKYGYTYTEDDRKVLQQSYFDYKGGTNYLPSVSNYYYKSSFGKLSLSGVVTPAVTTEQTFTEYLTESLSFGLEKVVQEITDYVYDYLFKYTKTYYNKDFDSNDDGKIDALVLSYSWFPMEAYYGTEMYDYVVYMLSQKVFFGSELGINVPVNSISWVSGRVSEISGTTYDSHIAINHTAQMMGVSNYSDTTGDYDGNLRSPLAHRDMMDGMIGDHNPFTKYQLGWIKPEKVIASDIQDSKEYTLKPYSTTGNSLLLAPEDTGLYGEYLLVEYYTPTNLNQPDAVAYYPYNYYGNYNYSARGIRVYKVDARLVEGPSASNVSLADDEPDFDKQIKLSNGKNVPVYYDYAYSNNGVNPYSSSGIYEDYALIQELSSKGFNRHMLDTTFSLSNEDLFLEGDGFGKEGDIDGFYTNYSFNGNGSGNDLLGLTFSVDSITADSATITIRRAN